MPRKPLLDQWRNQLAIFLGVAPKEIGEIQGNRKRPSGHLDVAMLQSMLHGHTVDDVVAQYGHVIVDECHHIPAASFERVLSEVPARYVTGLTATPQRQDGRDPIVRMQLGPTRMKVAAKFPSAAHPFRHVLIVRNTECVGLEGGPDFDITECCAALANDAQRNALIVDDVIATIREGRSPLVLTERREHVEFLAERLARHARNFFVLTGGMSEKARREVFRRLAAIPDNEPRTIVATGKFIGEGFDDAMLDTPFVTLPVSWKGVVAQYVGRLHRLHSGKREVRIFDYVDQEVPGLSRLFDRRLKSYHSFGYSIGALSEEFELCADPDGDADVDDVSVECDEVSDNA